MSDEYSRAAGRNSPALGDLTRTDAGIAPRGDPSPAPLGPGELVDRYEIVELRGAGGMGIVYRARDTDLGRDVALKLLRSGEREDAIQRRFLREAQAMASLAHPNLVTVYDVGTVAGRVFLAMEFVRGQTLTEWVRAEPRSHHEVLAIFRQAGAGLAAAHDAGLVHRDFKPDNVLVGDDGRVRVADFGLARSVLHAAENEDEPSPGRAPDGADMLATPLTRTGAMMGTPAYMAPEQHRGQPVAARADQFAFAVALYEALYGVRPFPGETHAEFLASLLAGTLRPPPGGDGVPPAVHPVLTRALRTDPDERYPDIPALLRALELAVGPKRSSGRRRVLGVALVAALAGTAGAGAFALWPEPEEPPPPAADGLEVGELVQLALEGKLDDAEIRWRVVNEVLGQLGDRSLLERLAVPAAEPPARHDASAEPDEDRTEAADD